MKYTLIENLLFSYIYCTFFFQTKDWFLTHLWTTNDFYMFSIRSSYPWALCKDVRSDSWSVHPTIFGRFIWVLFLIVFLITFLWFKLMTMSQWMPCCLSSHFLKSLYQYSLFFFCLKKSSHYFVYIFFSSTNSLECFSNTTFP